MPRRKSKSKTAGPQNAITNEETESLELEDDDLFLDDSTDSCNRKRKGDHEEESYDVEYLPTKLRRVEDQLKEKNKEPPPVIHLHESIDIATLEKFDRHNKVMMTQLKEFAAEMVFPPKKFILNKKDSSDLCIAAVRKQRVMLPENTTEQEFAQRYSGTMKTLLHRLIGYAQQIARERYMGKKLGKVL